MKEIFQCQRCENLDGFISSVPPIFSFGNYDNDCWLLSINPSYQEFFDKNMNDIPYPPVFRLDHYGIKNREEVTDVIAVEILGDQINYFIRNPYMKWFGQLERFFNKIGMSFGINGDANISNVDIVKCATYPTWSPLSDETKKKYCNTCSIHLINQLKSTQELKYIVINGKSVYMTLKRIIDNINLYNKISTITLSDKPKFEIYKGFFEIQDKKIKIIGANKVLNRPMKPENRNKYRLIVKKFIFNSA